MQVNISIFLRKIEFQTLHLIGNAAYEQKELQNFIKLKMNMQRNSNEYTTQTILTRRYLDAFHPFGLISRARPVTSKRNSLIKRHPLTSNAHAEVLRLQPTTSSVASRGGLTNWLVKQRRTLLVEVLVLLRVHCSFKDNVNEWVSFTCDGTGPADESKRTKRIQVWSRQNCLGVILIIVSLHIHP